MGFDVQGGGTDLVFPHHEMSAAQAHALTGERPFARAYVHAGDGGLDGEKMSKSQGNLVLRLRAAARTGVDPMAIRLALLAHHYRADWEWTDDGLAEAQERLGALARGGLAARRAVRQATLLGRVRVRAGRRPGRAGRAGRGRPLGGRGLDARRRRPGRDPALVSPRRVDALLGVASDSPVSTSGSDQAARRRCVRRQAAERVQRSTRGGREGLGLVAAAAQVALELPGDRLAAGLGQVGGVLGLLERRT